VCVGEVRQASPRPRDRNHGAVLLSISPLCRVLNPWNLTHLVGAEVDAVDDPTAFDERRAAVPIQRIGHCDNGLQRIALLPTGRADISLARGNSNVVIENVGDRLGGQPRTIVTDLDQRRLRSGRHRNRDLRRDLHLLGGVDRVVEQFLQYDQRPERRVMTDLGGQLAFADKVEQPAGLEDNALEPGGLLAHNVIRRQSLATLPVAQ
jgi:hypothetical protein